MFKTRNKISQKAVLSFNSDSWDQSLYASILRNPQYSQDTLNSLIRKSGFESNLPAGPFLILFSSNSYLYL